MMDQYILPLAERYVSQEMLYHYSPLHKFRTWRELWIYLAESQKELGLSMITQDQIDDLKNHKDNINWDRVKLYEAELKHDVMAHIHAYGEQATLAKPIIHLGATSAYVGDNTDLILMKGALGILKQKLVTIIAKLAEFANQHKSLPTLGYTHFQAAQLTTVGKRATLWLGSLLSDLDELEYVTQHLKFLGVKGTTGTQASFKELFHGDYAKVCALDNLVMKKAGFTQLQTVSGQTYDRKTDSRVLDLLSHIAQSAHKFTNDLRLLQHLKELEEPFESSQIGSSAMAYKRNPIRSERAASLAKFVISLAHNGELVASTQWLERTLDDSANRRLSLPQAFLSVDAILLIWMNILDGLVVYPKVIEANVARELPFIATENIIMAAVKQGQDRQDVHEVIRELSMQETVSIKQEGHTVNLLLERILKDGRITLTREQLKKSTEPSYFIGFAQEQVDLFLKQDVNPILKKYSTMIIKNKIHLSV